MTASRFAPPGPPRPLAGAITAVVVLAALSGCSAPGTGGNELPAQHPARPSAQMAPASPLRPAPPAVTTAATGAQPDGLVTTRPHPAPGHLDAALGLNEGLSSDRLWGLLNDSAAFEQTMAALDRAYAADADAQDVRSSYEHALQQRLGTESDAPKLSRLECSISHCLGEITGTLENPSALFGEPRDAAGRQLPVNAAMVTSILPTDGAPGGYRLVFSLDPTPRTGPSPAR